MRGASETGAYREWAGAWRAQQAASQRLWGRLGVLAALAGAVGISLLLGASPLFALKDARVPAEGKRVVARLPPAQAGAALK
jgi:hypothetical protein